MKVQLSYLGCWLLPLGPAAQCTRPGSAPDTAAGNGPGSGSPSSAGTAEPPSAHTRSTPWTSLLARPPDRETSWSARQGEGWQTVVVPGWAERRGEQRATSPKLYTGGLGETDRKIGGGLSSWLLMSLNTVGEAQRKHCDAILSSVLR